MRIALMRDSHRAGLSATESPRGFPWWLLIPGAKQVKQGLRSLPFAFTDKTHNCCRREETKSGFFCRRHL